MIADQVYVFFMFFGPYLVEKKEDKTGQFSPALQPLLFTVDITHMRRSWSQDIQVSCSLCISGAHPLRSYEEIGNDVLTFLLSLYIFVVICSSRLCYC